MNNSDIEILDTMITDLDSYYRIRVQATPATVKSYFNTLIDYSIDEVANAIEAHKADVAKGHRHPFASDLLYQLGVRAELNAAALLAEARMRSTPLGMRVLGHIPTSDFHALQEPVLLQRASQLLGRVDEWRSKHEQGNYTDGEVRQMVVSGVWPDAPFTSGENKPAHNESLKKQIERFCNNEDTPKIESDHPSGTVQSDYEGSSGKATPMPDSVRQAFSVLLNNVKV